MLAAKGCSTELANSSGKTGRQLAPAAAVEAQQAALPPCNHMTFRIFCSHMVQPVWMAANDPLNYFWMTQECFY